MSGRQQMSYLVRRIYVEFIGELVICTGVHMYGCTGPLGKYDW